MDVISMRLVRSDGAEMVLGSTPPGWTVEPSKMENWDEFEQDISTSEKVLTDGSNLIGKRLGQIDRTASAAYLSNEKSLLEARTEASVFFNPKYTFRAYLTCNGRTRWCEGELEAFKADVVKGRAVVEITFTLLCLDPYFKGTDSNDRSFTDAVPMFGFPFVSITERNGKIRGFNASVLVFDGKNTVYNRGDVPCRYTVRMEAEGEIVNPSITKDGKFVRIIDTLKSGDVVEIDFQSTPPTVRKNGKNIIQACSRDSTFTGMEMQVGANVFTVTMDNEENRSMLKTSVLHYENFLGV